MSDLLSIGASGIRAYQSALTTTSDNIANAATPGYVRRTTSLAEVGGATASRAGGQGVVVDGVTRSADAFRSAQVRQSGADLARSDAGIVWLDRIETSLNGQLLDERITAFFNSATALSADPSAAVPRAAMLEAAGSVAQAFNGTLRALDAAAADLDTTARDAAAKLGNVAGGLAKINDALGRATPGTTGQAQLFDQRDRLLEEMSALTDADVAFDPAGRVSVRGGGPSGPLLVHAGQAASVFYSRNEEGETIFAVRRAGVDSVLKSTAGAMAGMADGATRIADMRAATGTLAASFAGDVNAVLTNGQDLAGDPGTEMFAVADDGTLSVALDDPAKIAAASTDKGPRDNGNLAALAKMRTTARFEALTIALQAGNGTALSARKTIAEAQGAIRNSALAARDAASGVNLDEEAIDLMRFQQAYQASSRVIQIARETIDTLIAIR